MDNLLIATNAALKTKQRTNVPRIMLFRCEQNVAVRWQCLATCSNKKRQKVVALVKTQYRENV